MTDQSQPTQGDDTQSPSTSYVDSYQPPSAQPSTSPADQSSEPTEPSQSAEPSMPAVSHAGTSPVSQALEDQNIFFLLGVSDGTDAEKEEFLDELQQVIWEDFLENDVELLVTEEEMVDLKKIMADKSGSAEDQQERVIVFLEKLIPDLEEIMLEKALELKEDMVRGRMLGMRDYFADQVDKVAKLDEAETPINDDQWRAAAELLNSLR